MTCPACHATLIEGLRYCTSCGRDLQSAPPAPAAEAASAAGLSWAAAPEPDAPQGARGTPWEQRERLGWATALIETTKGVLFAPKRFFSEMPTSGGIGAPLAYGVLLAYVSSVIAVFYQFLWFRLRGTTEFEPFRGTPLEPAIEILTSPWMILLQIVLGPAFAAMALFLRAGITHLGLMLVGGAKQGFEATLRVVAYSEAATLALLVPLCGQYVLVVWLALVTIIGASRAHGIGAGRATAGILLLPALFFCLCCGLGVVAAMMAGFSAASLQR